MNFDLPGSHLCKVPLQAEIALKLQSNISADVLNCDGRLPQIPTLVLDCDHDVDVEKDKVYRKLVATQVQDYLKYVAVYAQARATAQAKVRLQTC
jgi:hypothetical protein